MKYKHVKVATDSYPETKVMRFYFVSFLLQLRQISNIQKQFP